MLTTDGHVLTHAVQFRGNNKRSSSMGQNSLIKARIDEVIYPDDERNSTFNSSQKQVEYECTVVGGIADGMKLSGVIDSVGGSQYNKIKRVRTATSNTPSKDKDEESETRPGKLNGEMVLIQRLFGNGNSPIIVGNFPNPLDQDSPKKDDGAFYEQELNGVRIRIDKDGQFNVLFGGGPKDKDGKPADEDAAGSSFSIDKDGVMTFSDAEQQEFKIDRKNKTISFGKSGNAMSLNTNSGAFDMGNSGTTNIDSGGTLNLKAGGTAQLQGSIAFIQGGGLPAARMSDTCFGIGNHGAPVISQIITGSGSALIGG